jgi:hypothetical protein
MAMATPLARMMFSPSTSFTSRTPPSPFTPSVAQTFVAGLGAGVTLSSPTAPDYSPPSGTSIRGSRSANSGLATVSEDQSQMTPTARTVSGHDTDRPSSDQLSVAHSQRFRAVV